MSYDDIAFWDRIAARYAAKPISDEAAYRYKVERTRNYLRSDMDVLEFGCGTGSTALEHAPHVGSYLATDISPGMIEIARGKVEGTPIEGLRFRAGALQTLALPDGSFDAVLGLNVLHLLADVQGAIYETARLLKPGGIFVSSTACLRDTMPWFAPVGRIGSLLRLMPRVTMLRASDLIATQEQAGLEVIEHWRAKKNRLVLFLIARKR